MSDLPSKKIRNILGQKFGQWTVLSFSHVSDNAGHPAMWNVECSCGNKSVNTTTSLVSGRSTRCRSCNGKERGRKGLYTQSKDDPVYFIRCGPYVKIGSSKDIPRRLRDLEASNPYALSLIATDEDEEFWHNVFKHRHHRGEWYLWCM